MVTPDRNRQATMQTTYIRPVPLAARPSVGTTSPSAPVSFRSALLRAQQTCLLPKTRARVSENPVQLLGPASTTLSSRNPVSGSGTGLNAGDILERATAGNVENAPTFQVQAQNPRLSSISASVPTSGVSASPTAMALADFPRPAGDNGRGMHWVPITRTSNDVVDRFVKEAKEMKIKWMVILNDDAKIGDNDYLVKQLVNNGIMPIMRIYTPHGRPIQGDLKALVNHYRPMGVQYYQLYNEPNLNVENPDGVPSVDKYLDKWIPAAKQVAEVGGLPGFGALSPGGNFDDMEFLRQSLDEIKRRGEIGALDKAWLSMHNYTLNHPLNYSKDSNCFMKFKWYDSIIREKLGRQMPIIGTEGGTHIGSADDKTFPPIDEAKQIDMVTGAYRYMKNREPYNFVYTYWIIANEEGGGHDGAFSHQALFRPDGRSPLVDALKKLE